MSERARARVIAGSMGVVSAGLVLALLLGVSFLAAHLLQPFAARAGGALVGPPAGSTQHSGAARPAIFLGPRAGSTGAAGAHHPERAAAGGTGSTHPASSGSVATASSRTTAGVGVEAGPVGAGASVRADGSGASATVTAHAGSVGVTVGVKTHRVVAHSTKTVVDVICHLAC